MDTLIGLLAGIFIGANLGFVIAGLFGGVRDENVFDQ